jgi:hypothetical protein
MLQVLGAWLGEPTCPLAVLSLERADVDDTECVALVGKIQRNRLSELRSLSLARNLLGDGELRNVVQPSFVTGAEAISEWLTSRACAIRSLDLSWNKIRGDSGVQLGATLAENRSLQHLVLAGNGLGVDGGGSLGKARSNQHSHHQHRTLVLSYSLLPPPLSARPYSTTRRFESSTSRTTLSGRALLM